MFLVVLDVSGQTVLDPSLSQCNVVLRCVFFILINPLIKVSVFIDYTINKKLQHGAAGKSSINKCVKCLNINYNNNYVGFKYCAESEVINVTGKVGLSLRTSTSVIN